MVSGAGPAIKERRELRGLTRPELAALVGCSYQHIYNVETGQKGISLVLLSRIARKLGVSVATLRLAEDAA